MVPWFIYPSSLDLLKYLKINLSKMELVSFLLKPGSQGFWLHLHNRLPAPLLSPVPIISCHFQDKNLHTDLSTTVLGLPNPFPT